MLRIEIELFSGRPNPVWYVTDSAEADRLLGEVSGNEGVIARPGAGYDGLGFREVRVEFLEETPAKVKGVPRQFALASTASRDFKASGALAQRLIEAMPLRSKVQLLEHALTPLDAKLREGVLERLQRYLADPPRPTPPPPAPPRSSLRTTIKDEKCGKCEYEVSQYNPGFWNGAGVIGHNNCYNYARNWRTNTFAQPGRAHGAMTSTMACNTVSAAAMADGLRKRCDCLSEKEYPRRLMALVIDPGYDYHWYRHQRGGFWGHKPGGTAARNYDNSGQLILNPETCNRGGYTHFCGYFYAGRSVVIN
ncbi:hypothetical protein [Xanthomonas bundabergensis]|uniref:hypothetical protein n=1 Tax=Xanthomonas bundabergensis TaxID=3160842 RepID=UPI0035170D66